MREPTPSSPMEAHQPGDDGDATTTGAEEEDQGGREQPRQAGGDIASAMARAAEAHPDDIDKQIEVALQCPCVEDMMTSPCKETFVDSFTCFMKSDHHEVKGYDCVEQFERFQACLVANPGVIGAYWPRSTCARGHSRDAHSCSLAPCALLVRQTTLSRGTSKKKHGEETTTAPDSERATESNIELISLFARGRSTPCTPT